METATTVADNSAKDSASSSGSSTPTCTKAGYVRDSSDCNIYYYCLLVGTTYIPIAQRCSSNLYFDETIQTCNWPQLVSGCWIFSVYISAFIYIFHTKIVKLIKDKFTSISIFHFLFLTYFYLIISGYIFDLITTTTVICFVIFLAPCFMRTHPFREKCYRKHYFTCSTICQSYEHSV